MRHFYEKYLLQIEENDKMDDDMDVFSGNDLFCF